jgi:hypothetical protein
VVIPIEPRSRIFSSSNSSPLYEKDVAVQLLIARCRDWKGDYYPPPDVNEVFSGALSKIRIERSKIHGKGAFVRGRLTKGETFGFYEGSVTRNRGSYVMSLFEGSSEQRNVDADPTSLGYDTIYGSINEDLYGGVPNAEVRTSGLFITLRDIENEAKEFGMIKIYGNEKSKNLILSWGSTKGAILDALSEIDAKFVQVLYMNPFPTKQVEDLIGKARKVLVIENNSESPLSRLIAEKTGFMVENKILKYDGRPFFGDELVEELRRKMK